MQFQDETNSEIARYRVALTEETRENENTRKFKINENSWIRAIQGFTSNNNYASADFIRVETFASINVDINIRRIAMRMADKRIDSQQSF